MSDELQDRANAIMTDMVGRALTPATMMELRQRLHAMVSDAVCSGDMRPDAIVEVEREPHDHSKLHVLVRPAVIDAEYYTEATGDAPCNDDLERVNCDKAGSMGHLSCGWCPICNRPRYQCGHRRTP